MTTVAQLVVARSDDRQPAIRFEHDEFSWAETVDATRVRAAVARALCDPSRPSHVGVLLDNVPEFVFWIGAAALARAAVVGINPTRRGEALAHDIRHTDCQMIVTDAKGLQLLEGLDTGVARDRVLLVDSPDYLEQLEATGGAPSSVFGVADRGEPAPSDVLLLVLTSGSTGAPKAVICTQGRMARVAEAAPNRLGIERSSVLYLSMPLFHSNSIMVGLLPALKVGATVALRRRFSASGFLPDVRRFGATYFNYVGRALSYILETPEQPDDYDNPLLVGFGTEAAPRDVEQFARRFGCALSDGYGSSEGAVRIDRTADTPAHALGVAVHGTDVAIMDADTGLECPRAEFDAFGRILNADLAIGEIVGLNAAAAFEGYYNNAEANDARVRHGNYWTGDLGYRDQAGFVYFAGRNTDWLRVDGENFAAAPIERILVRHPAVVAAFVYAVPDPRADDQVMVALQLDDTLAFDGARLHEFLAEQRDLGTKWAPRFVRVLEARPPTTATNKIDKQPLRAAGWRTSDTIWWRPDRQREYRRLTTEDASSLEEAHLAFGRAAEGIGAPADESASG